MNSPEIIQCLPDALQREDKIPKVILKLDKPIRNKIMNYKETVRSIKQINEDGVNFAVNSETNLPYPCTCSESNFCDPHHGHIVTGDLRIIENNKLRKLLSKGPNYRENKTINYSKCAKTVDDALFLCSAKLANKLQCDISLFTNWQSEIKRKVADKIRYLKSTTIPQQTKLVLKDEVVRTYLTELHKKYVVVPIDKASNNIAIICKQFYVNRLLKEVGIPGDTVPTYQISLENKEEIISTNAELCHRYGLNLSEDQQILPIMYWTPKMHYTPSRARFIMASANCSTKPLSRVMSNTFKLIVNQVQNFHDKSTFYRNYNRFWVIKNSKPLIDKLDVINTKKRAKEISTFDFSTLYTKLPHNDLVRVLNEIVDFVFDGGSRNFLGFTENITFWKNKKSGKNYFSRYKLKTLIKHLITNTYFEVGNLLFRQCIGIPMGIDPAPFWANLYLYHYEHKFITSLMRTDKFRARRFLHSTRFIDDQCNINDSSEFSRSHADIYPQELQLKCEHQGGHATFLDLDITIVDNIFVYKLFDKRDGFPFSIVRMPDLSGNIPSHIFYGSIMSEFLRIARATLLLIDFIPRASILYKRMINQGGSVNKIFRQIRKVMSRHPEPFLKYKLPSNVIITQIIGQQ